MFVPTLILCLLTFLPVGLSLFTVEKVGGLDITGISGPVFTLSLAFTGTSTTKVTSNTSLAFSLATLDHPNLISCNDLQITPASTRHFLPTSCLYNSTIDSGAFLGAALSNSSASITFVPASSGDPVPLVLDALETPLVSKIYTTGTFDALFSGVANIEVEFKNGFSGVLVTVVGITGKMSVKPKSGGNLIEIGSVEADPLSSSVVIQAKSTAKSDVIPATLGFTMSQALDIVDSIDSKDGVVEAIVNGDVSVKVGELPLTVVLKDYSVPASVE
ncbi:hypothetical protein BJ742DRAFT_892181 [Cladochytrium replicatum]|nr:hypothetical protein BJ742DRAFT_892181 [Cladochytrium replicatum]